MSNIVSQLTLLKTFSTSISPAQVAILATSLAASVYVGLSSSYATIWVEIVTFASFARVANCGEGKIVSGVGDGVVSTKVGIEVADPDVEGDGSIIGGVCVSSGVAVAFPPPQAASVKAINASPARSVSLLALLRFCIRYCLIQI